MKYRLVIFDMDGTFADSRSYHAYVFYEFLKAEYREVDLKTCRMLVGKTVKQIFDEVGVPAETQKCMYPRLDRYYSEFGPKYIDEVSSPDGFKDLLITLGKMGIRRAVVTNSIEYVMKQFLAKLDLKELFDAAVGADGLSEGKSARCRAQIERFGVLPEETLIVGDAESDIELANRLGTDFCFAATDIAWYRDRDYIQNQLRPTMTAENFRDLERMFGEEK